MRCPHDLTPRIPLPPPLAAHGPPLPPDALLACIGRVLAAVDRMGGGSGSGGGGGGGGGGRANKGSQSSHNKVVRVLCAFLQSLLRHNALLPAAAAAAAGAAGAAGGSGGEGGAFAPLMAQLQAFCVEHSRIKEAAALYKALKALD